MNSAAKMNDQFIVLQRVNVLIDATGCYVVGLSRGKGLSVGKVDQPSIKTGRSRYRRTEPFGIVGQPTGPGDPTVRSTHSNGSRGRPRQTQNEFVYFFLLASVY